MSRFVSSWRTRPDVIRLAGERDEGAWTVRVQCAEAWDSVRVELVPGTRVSDVKRAAMAVLVPDVRDAGDFVVKVHGLEVHDENGSVQAAGATDGSTLLITSRRRRPVR